MAHRSAITPRPVHRRAGESPAAWDDRPNANGPDNGVSPTVPGDPNERMTEANWDLTNAQPWSGWMNDWGTPYLEPGGLDNWSGYGYGRHSPDGYMARVSTVMTCVDLNSRQLGSFPIYGLKGYNPVMLPDWRHTPAPDLYSSWDDFLKTAVNVYQLHGEVIIYALARYADGFPRQFAILNPAHVEIEWDENGRRRYLLGEQRLEETDVCHIRYQSLPASPRGIGPLEWIGRNLTAAGSLEKYAADIAQQGVWAVLKHPSNLNRRQSTDLQAGWVSARKRSDGAPAVLSGGVELETLSLSPKDMALLDLRVFDEQRIASAFGVPPFLVGLPNPGGMTYSNVTSLFDFHWRATLRPMAQTFSDALSNWLLPRGTRIEFNPDRYVQPSLGERAQAYSVLHNIANEAGEAAMSVDEVRIAERLQPRDVVSPHTDISSITGNAERG